MKGDSLGDRMKGYEKVTKSKLMKRTPVIIRIDGKAFHTWTKCLKTFDGSLEREPFSTVMHNAMVKTTEDLVNNIQNAVLGYTQSDEISILLNDWRQLNTSQWFDNSIQKMASVSASMATAYFARAFQQEVLMAKGWGPDEYTVAPAMFDARVFNMPKEEVANYFVWRQQDASRNSVQMLARHYFSHKQLHKKNNSEIQDMLMLEKGVNWNDIDTWKKRGSCVQRVGVREDGIVDVFAKETRVVVDEDIPVFTQVRGYIFKHLMETQI